jgi:hypothetical protein
MSMLTCVMRSVTSSDTTQAGGVQHFEHGAVAQAQRVLGVRRIEQLFDILLGEALEQVARQLGRVDLQGGIGGDLALPEQIAEQPLEAGDVAPVLLGLAFCTVTRWAR